QHVSAAAAALRSRGLSSDHRVGILAPNSAGFVVAVHALMRLGAVIVPLNIRLTESELDWQRRDARLEVVLEEPDLRQLLTTKGTVAPREFDLTAPHSIIYTSGTTGRPKGAILTYANHWWSAISSALNLGLEPTDRWLACLPLFHVGGLSIL